MMAAITPQACIARCAGVQKVSRPMDRCHATSHAPPMEAEVTAKAPNQIYQGTEAVSSYARVTSTAPARFMERGEVDIEPHMIWPYLILPSLSSPVIAGISPHAEPWRKTKPLFRRKNTREEEKQYRSDGGDQESSSQTMKMRGDRSSEPWEDGPSQRSAGEEHAKLCMVPRACKKERGDEGIERGEAQCRHHGQ